MSNEISIIKSYIQMAENFSSHKSLLKEKTGILYAATALGSSNLDCVSIAVDFFRLLIANEDNHKKLLILFGIMEALESASIRLRLVYPELSETARQLVVALQQASPLPLNIKHRYRNIYKNKTKYLVFVLYITGLNPDTGRNLESALIFIQGVVSVVIDIDHQRCTLRVKPHIPIRYIIQEILLTCGLRARLVARNSKNQEILKDLHSSSDDEDEEEDNLPPYLPEEDSPIKATAITSARKFSNWVQSATSFLDKTFYW